MKRRVWLLLLLALMLSAGFWFWQSKEAELARPAPEVPGVPLEPAIPASGPASVPVGGTVSLSLPAPEKPIAQEEVPQALEALIGSKAVSSFLQVDQFARRVAATVDNLGRSHAPPALWPVHPTPGRFAVDEVGGSSVVALENAARYTPLVLLVETIDVGKAADLYLAMYPLLQQEYRGLGYPNRQFNDRLLEVIELLLAAPELEQPPKVALVEVKGPIPSVRPWVRYEFTDPNLEAMASGQKILIRVGIVNERRLKIRLAEFRDEIIKRAQKR
jgi:hypothetical protein